MTIERRSVKRFRAVDGALAALCPESGRVGQIHNISSDGLAFRYIAGAAADTDQNGTARLQIMFAGEGVWLEDLAVKRIAEIDVRAEGSFSGIPLRQVCLQFVSLTDSQKYSLKEYIRRYTDRTH